MRFKTILLLLICSFSLTQGFANETNEEVKERLLLEANRVSELLEYDSSFVEQVELTIRLMDAADVDENTRADHLQRMVDHYAVIQHHNKSRVKRDFEESYLFWAAPFLEMNSDTEALTNKVAKGFPDTYFAARNLVPQILTDSILY